VGARPSAARGPLAAVLLIGAMVASAAPAQASTPSTSYPTIKGCKGSSFWRAAADEPYLSKHDFLRRAFRRAHVYTWRAHSTVSFIRNRPDAERAELWRRSGVARNPSPAPHRWFGRYDKKRADFVGRALRRGAGRFAGNADGSVKRIKTLRCGRVRVKHSEHTHSCPKRNPGGSGPPTLFHSPAGRIVTCNRFWNGVSERHNAFDFDPQARLDYAAQKLIHEVFHYVKLDRQWVWDRRQCNKGRAGKKKCYGEANATYLAQHKPGTARRNNSNYEYFAMAAGGHQPTFSGVWAEQESFLDLGRARLDLSFAQVHQVLDAEPQTVHLADIEAYQRGGQRRYAGLWRLGCCKGPLVRITDHDLANGLKVFADWFALVSQRHNITDVEIGRLPHGEWEILGSYRVRQPGERRAGLQLGMSWDGLHRMRSELAETGRYLADVEHYVTQSGSTRYLGVWLPAEPRPAGEHFIKTGDRKLFNDRRKHFDADSQLVDYERVVTPGGAVHQIGIWRRGRPGRELERDLLPGPFIAREQELRTTRPLIDLEQHSGLPAEIP
jgi:hypothetical protein